ncbi:MAG: hypothetical protein RSB94_06390 [Erysipelotrichaceae bacterium]
MFNKGDLVSVKGYEGEVIETGCESVLVHFGGDSLHFIQEWCKESDVTLIEQIHESK